MVTKPQEVPLASEAEVIPVLVSPVTAVAKSSTPHLSEVRYWGLGEFRSWARAAIGVVRQLRRTFPGAGDLAWRAEAMTQFRANKLDPDGFLNDVLARRCSDLPVKGP
jgi:hypothetical protein